jgi:signal transduction histidine kinase
MRWLLYLRLFTLTAGTLLPFFWMVVILGHRRQRNFERVFFFLCLALTCFFGSSLLAINAQLFYQNPPGALLRFAWIFVCLGLWFTPPLVLQLHVEYASLRGLLDSDGTKPVWLAVAWLPAVAFTLHIGRSLLSAGFDFDRPTHSLGVAFQVWLVASMLVTAYWQERFVNTSPDQEQRRFHRTTEIVLIIISVLLIQTFVAQRFFPAAVAAESSELLMLLALLPLGILIGNVRRFNFLQIGRQRNLIYAVIGVFLALLYLSLVRRAGLWLEPYLPPEATAALLLFLPVVFFEPLQRMVGRVLKATARREMDVVYRLSTRIQREARQGDLHELIAFIERQVREEFEFEEVWLKLLEPKLAPPGDLKEEHPNDESFSIYRPGRLNGVMTVRPHGAMLSGEVVAAMQFLCEGIAGSIDLCTVLEEKLQLERELAERERMALVGQMAASISHNLKNPLGSIKTILQVQLESPDMPASLRGETQMVLDEINRLSAKLNQLLQFSRPGVRSSTKRDRCNVASVTASVVEVLRHEAEPSGVALEFPQRNGECQVAASSETVNDILSNVVLNAIEAVGRGGHVSLSLRSGGASCTVAVEDDGPGIPPALKEKILTPFFTTKARGTGLGLAIVTRRLEEIGGELQIESPIRDQRGSRFRVILPLASKEKAT